MVIFHSTVLYSLSPDSYAGIIDLMIGIDQIRGGGY